MVSSSSSSSWCGNSPSVKLLCFMVLLVFASGFLWVLGPKSPGWIPNSSNLSSSSSSNISSAVKQYEKTEHSVLVNPCSSSSSFVLPTGGCSLPPVAQPVPSDTVTDKQPLDFPANSSGGASYAPANSEFSSPSPAAPELQRVVVTDLDRVEAGLRRAREAIKAAKNEKEIYDPEYTPMGPMYHNANAFHRSYLEMEKQLKVYVYKDGEPPIFHNGPCKSIYSTEGNFIHQMELSTFRTKNPDKAHVFFLPFSVVMLVRYVYVRDSHDFSPIRQTVRDYTKLVSDKYPYWNRSLAADHFMLSCHDWGPETSFSVPFLRNNAIRVLCNANTSEGFRPEKDVSFPEINLQTGTIRGFLGGPSPSRRPILAFFAGGLHGPIRPALLDHWKNKDGDIKVYQYLPSGVNYYDMLRKSKYCLCPSGYEVASPRIVEAIYTGCVPVLISDHYVPPFSDVLNWKAFSVEVSPEEIPNLKNILNSITPRQYIRMYRRVVQIRRHFEVHNPPKRYDVFHMVLHSVWLRRLNVRVEGHQEQ
ncbi:hypothetical protein V2J09_010646 [Rumex salicifolius]